MWGTPCFLKRGRHDHYSFLLLSLIMTWSLPHVLPYWYCTPISRVAPYRYDQPQADTSSRRQNPQDDNNPFATGWVRMGHRCCCRLLFGGTVAPWKIRHTWNPVLLVCTESYALSHSFWRHRAPCIRRDDDSRYAIFRRKNKTGIIQQCRKSIVVCGLLPPFHKTQPTTIT